VSTEINKTRARLFVYLTTYITRLHNGTAPGRMGLMHTYSSQTQFTNWHCATQQAVSFEEEIKLPEPSCKKFKTLQRMGGISSDPFLFRCPKQRRKQQGKGNRAVAEAVLAVSRLLTSRVHDCLNFVDDELHKWSGISYPTWFRLTGRALNHICY